MLIFGMQIHFGQVRISRSLDRGQGHQKKTRYKIHTYALGPPSVVRLYVLKAIDLESYIFLCRYTFSSSFLYQGHRVKVIGSRSGLQQQKSVYVVFCAMVVCLSLKLKILFAVEFK